MQTFLKKSRGILRKQNNIISLIVSVSSKEKEWLRPGQSYFLQMTHVLPSTFELHIHKHIAIAYQFPAASAFALMGSKLRYLQELQQ